VIRSAATKLTRSGSCPQWRPRPSRSGSRSGSTGVPRSLGGPGRATSSAARYEVHAGGSSARRRSARSPTASRRPQRGRPRRPRPGPQRGEEPVGGGVLASILDGVVDDPDQHRLLPAFCGGLAYRRRRQSISAAARGKWWPTLSDADRDERLGQPRKALVHDLGVRKIGTHLGDAHQFGPHHRVGRLLR
jgi:hypothetical protein